MLPRMRSRGSRLVALTAAAAVVSTVTYGVSAFAAAKETVWERGRIVQHSDGDTPYVDIWGDRTTAKKAIRLIDVQATETAHRINGRITGKNWCHGQPAKRRAEQLMPKGRYVTLRSVHRNNAADFTGRPGRTVRVRRSDGSFSDPQRTLLNEGHVMWFPHRTEQVHNREYHVLSARAADAGRNIWDRDYCGSGPAQSAALRVWAHHDANGADDKDNAHRNDEYVIVRNQGGAGTLNLGGWYVRDTALYMYRFPAGTRLPAGEELRVHVGKGTDRNTATGAAAHRYWGLSKSILGERTRAGPDGFGLSAHMGDGAFLLDPQGDFRAWSTYPCVRDCVDPTGGRLAISEVAYNVPGEDSGNEYAVLRNTGTARIDLSHLQLRSWPWNYMFPTGFELGGGEQVTVHIVDSPHHPADTAHHLYWFPSTSSILNDTDELDVSTLEDVLVACRTWRAGGGPAATCVH